MHIFFLVVLYIMFFTQGATVSCLGPVWPRFVSDIGVETSQLGTATSILFAFAIVTELSSFRLRKILGNTYTLLAGFIAMFISLILLYKANSIIMIFVSVACFGLGLGIVDATVNAFATLYYEAKYVSWIHAIYGIGGVISSLIIANYLLPEKNYRMAFIVLNIFVIVSMILLVLTKIILKNKIFDTGEVGKRVREEKEDTTVSMLSVIQNKYVVILLLIFFVVDGIKWLINSWLPTYLVDIGMSTETYAARSLSFFLGSYMCSRIIFGALSSKLSDKTIITISCIISTIGYALLLVPNINNNMIIAFIVISGLGSGAFYPFFVHFTNEICEKKEVGAVIAYSGVFAVLGDVVQGVIMAAMVKYVGLRYLFIYQFILMVLIFVGFIILTFKKPIKKTVKK